MRDEGWAFDLELQKIIPTSKNQKRGSAAFGLVDLGERRPQPTPSAFWLF